MDFYLKLFTMACIDEARAQAARSKVKAYSQYHRRLLAALEPLLRSFIRTDCLPVPKEVEETTMKVRLPYTPGKRNWKLSLSSNLIRLKFLERREILRTFVKKLFSNQQCLFACCRILCCDFWYVNIF